MTARSVGAPNMPIDSLTVLRSKAWAGVYPTKTWHPDGSVRVSKSPAKAWVVESLPLTDFIDLAALLTAIQEDPRAAIVRGALRPDARPLSTIDDARYFARDLSTFADTPHHWLLIDCDNFLPVLADPVTDPVAAIREFIAYALPAPFAEASFFWQLSSSAGKVGSEDLLKAHLWFWLAEPVNSYTLRAWAEGTGLTKTGRSKAGSLSKIDAAVFNPVQLHYCAWPIVARGAVCPVPNVEGRRYGIETGLLGDDVYLDLSAWVEPGNAAHARHILGASLSPSDGALVSAAERLRSTDDPILSLLLEKGLVLRETGRGSWFIDCPCALEHTTPANDTECEYSPAGAGKYPRDYWMIACLHAGCRGRSQAQWLDALGADKSAMLAEASARDFEAALAPDDDNLLDLLGDEFAGLMPVDRAPLASQIRTRGTADTLEFLDLDNLPKAQFAATDQANALRFITRHRHELLVVDGRWMVWDGTHWAPDEASVHRRAWHLSRFVLADARLMKENAAVAARGGDTAEADKLSEMAESLLKWAKVSEDSARIAAAVAMAKKVLEVPSSRLDADPWLLNCSNGTVDLRTGVLKPHDPRDMITKLAGGAYAENANCPHWERVIAQICGEWDAKTEAVAASACETLDPLIGDLLGGSVGSARARRGAVSGFLQRWFGYCSTGSVREPMFVVHYGDGSNGKSTVLSVVAAVLADYAMTAAPRLLASSRAERHPAEIAAMHGRRMITAHETDEGAVLREDFIKAASGGDGEKITARHMHGDFFEFQPTAKLQLLTNHRPKIYGQDKGIWRRLALVPYDVNFGTAAEYAAGAANYLKDEAMAQKLSQERDGILSWLVRGAVEWFGAGLLPPARVQAASLGYRTDSDRFGSFIAECCEIGTDLTCYLTSPDGGVYSAYRAWCEQSGISPWAKPRFLEALEKALPTCAIVDKKMTFTCGRRMVKVISGLGLISEF